jgi:hypothetical protein
VSSQRITHHKTQKKSRSEDDLNITDKKQKSSAKKENEKRNRSPLVPTSSKKSNVKKSNVEKSNVGESTVEESIVGESIVGESNVGESASVVAPPKRATRESDESLSHTSSVVSPSCCTSFLKGLLRLQFDRLKHLSCKVELFPQVSDLKKSIFDEWGKDWEKNSPSTLDDFMLCACDDTDIARALFSRSPTQESDLVLDESLRVNLPKLLRDSHQATDTRTPTSPYDLEAIWRRTPFKNHKLTFATVRSILDCFHDFWDTRNTEDKEGFNTHTRAQLIEMINSILAQCGINKSFTVDTYRDALCFLTDGAITSCSGNFEANVVEFLVNYSGTGKVFKLKTLTAKELLAARRTNALGTIKSQFSGIRLEFDPDDTENEHVGEAIIKLLGWENDDLHLFATFDAGSPLTKLVFDAIRRVKFLQTQANMFDSGTVEEVWTEERKFVSIKPDVYTCDPKQFMTRIAVADGKGIARQTDDEGSNPEYPLFKFKSFTERFPNRGPLSFILELHLSATKLYQWTFGYVETTKKTIKNGPSAAALEAAARFGLCGKGASDPKYPGILSVTCDMRNVVGGIPKGERCNALDELFMKNFAAYAVKCYGDSEQSRMAYMILQGVFNDNWRCILAGVDQISCITAALRRNMAGFCSLNAAKALLIYFPLNETPLGVVDEFGVVLYEFQTFGEKLKILLEEGITLGDIDHIMGFIDASIRHNGECKGNPKMTVSGKIVIDLVVSRLNSIQTMLEKFKGTVIELRAEPRGNNQFGGLAQTLLNLLNDESHKSAITQFLNKHPTIKQYAIRIMKEAVKVGNMKYMSALTLLETIFDTKTTILDKQLISIKQISTYCAGKLEPGKFLVGFDFKLANMKLNNSITCSQLKFKYEDYRKLYVSLSEYEDLFKNFTPPGRTQGFIKRYTSIIPRIEEQLDTIQKNHIENGSALEINESENGLTSILFELQKVDTVEKILEGPPPSPPPSPPPAKKTKVSVVVEPTTTPDQPKVGLEFKPKLASDVNQKILEKRAELKRQRGELDKILKDPKNIKAIMKAFNDAKEILRIADINAANLGDTGGPIDSIKTGLAQGISVFSGGKRKKRTRDIMVGGRRRSVKSLLETLKEPQKNELFDMLFQLFANVHRQVLDVFFSIAIELCGNECVADMTIQKCFGRILTVVNNYYLCASEPAHITRTKKALTMIADLIDDINYTVVEVGFRRIILHFVNCCEFEHLDGYDSVDDFKIWEILPDQTDVILMYYYLKTQFGDWKGPPPPPPLPVHDLFESDSFPNYPFSSSFPIPNEEEVEDGAVANATPSGDENKSHDNVPPPQNNDFESIVGVTVINIKHYTGLLSADDTTTSIRYEEFLRHITFLIVMLYNANNTYKPTYVKDNHINTSKTIYQPDYNELLETQQPSPRLSASERRKLSRDIFNSNISETNTVLAKINGKIHKFSSILQKNIGAISEVPAPAAHTHSRTQTCRESSEQTFSHMGSTGAESAAAVMGGSSRKYTRKKVIHLNQIRNTRRNNKRTNVANQSRRHSHKYRSSSTRRKRSLKNNK